MNFKKAAGEVNCKNCILTYETVKRILKMLSEKKPVTTGYLGTFPLV